MTPNTHAKTVAIDEVAVGMSLAESVLGEKGDVVLAQGVALTEALIRALRRRGIGSLLVCVDEPQRDGGAERQQRLDRLARLFRLAVPHSGAAYLQALVTQYRTQEAP